MPDSKLTDLGSLAAIVPANLLLYVVDTSEAVLANKSKKLAYTLFEAYNDGRYATFAQGATADSAVQPADLALVATTGAYADLSGTPTLATVATSGAYGDLSGLPTLGTLAAINDAPSNGSQYARIDGAWAVVSGGVTSVFTRTGAVVSASGDYTAAQVTNAAAGNIAATDVQAAIAELDGEKAGLALANTFTALQTINNADLDLAGTGIYKLIGSRVLHRTGDSFYVGVGAGNLTATGAENVAIGNDAMAAVTSGNTNVAVGDAALFNLQTGVGNIAIGRRSLINYTGSNTVAIGLSALAALSSGTNNIAIGNQAGEALQTGTNNTILGYRAGLVLTGSINTFIGRQAGISVVGGGSNVMLGNSADGLAAGSNQISIGTGATCDASNQVTIGATPNNGANQIRQIMQTALTNSIQNAFIFKHNTSGTPAAGYGTALVFQGESSTTVDQDMARLTTEWATATHATRAARGKLTAFYTSTERTAIQWEADSVGSLITLGGNVTIQDKTDLTKQMLFNLSGLTTGATRIMTPPNADATIAGTNLAQTFTATQKINVNSATAFFVEQDGVQDNTLVVDTTNGRVGVGIAPTVSAFEVSSAGVEIASFLRTSSLHAVMKFGNTLGTFYLGATSSTADFGVGLTTNLLAQALLTVTRANGYLGIGNQVPLAMLHPIAFTGTNNASIVNVAIIGRNHSGTAPAAGFGEGVAFQGQSSTTAAQDMARLTVEWATATHASRKARGKLTIYDTAEREAIRWEADGAAAMLGFLGAAAIARPATYTLASTAGRVLPTPEATFTGQDNAQVGSVYAKSADIITLQTRLNDVEGVLRQLIIDLASTSGYGLLVAS